MKWIGRLWRGEIALSRAFWLFGVLVPILLAVAAWALGKAALILLLLFAFSGPSAPDWVNSVPQATVVVAVLPFAYQVLACVGVWRSAAKFSGRLVYSIVARGVVCLYLGATAFIAGANAYAWATTFKGMSSGH